MPDNYHACLTVKGTIQPRFKAIVERVARGTGASYALLQLCDHDSSELRNAAGYGLDCPPESYAAVASLVLSRGEVICLPEEASARKTIGFSPDKVALPLICAPVVSNTLRRGILIVAWPQGAGEEFSHYLPLIESSAELIAALLENSSLQRELYRKEEQVRELIRDTLDAQEAERERICLEVHDGVTQTLASAFQYLQTLETTSPEGTQARQLLLRASSLVKQAIQESREVINSLQPATLRDLGLVTTLCQEMRQLEQETRWKVDFSADSIRLPADIETGLYRIVHEAITNVRKHADSDRLRVSLVRVGDQLKIEIRDWGIGFNYNPHDTSRRRGTGLLSMRKRAELLQGTCRIESSPGHGTTVCVEIPLSH